MKLHTFPQNTVTLHQNKQPTPESRNTTFRARRTIRHTLTNVFDNPGISETPLDEVYDTSLQICGLSGMHVCVCARTCIQHSPKRSLSTLLFLQSALGVLETGQVRVPKRERTLKRSMSHSGNQGKALRCQPTDTLHGTAKHTNALAAITTGWPCHKDQTSPVQNKETYNMKTEVQRKPSL